ncbi:hypothetical protein ACGYK3_13990 [Sulfitobacter sp. 1A05707]|uniref:hypothetical protein n=1 Tax=Sulfitobacter sp. 1A05707 TaxID=3368560 RepID=UPI003745803D
MKTKKKVTLLLSNSSLLVVGDLITMKRQMSRASNQKYAAGRDDQKKQFGLFGYVAVGFLTASMIWQG